MPAPETIIIRSFAGGELAPSLAARADLAKYSIGLRRCRNFIVQRHGGVANRPGTRLIAPCATNDVDVKLVRYTHELPDQSVLIEFGEGYLRFYFDDALVELSGVSAWSALTNYEIGDIVVSGGTNYYAIAPSLNQAPPNATFWYAMPGDILEIPHPFMDPRETQVTQSGRIVTFTHPDEVPHDLVFLDLTRWAMVPLVTQPKVIPPVNLVLTPGGAGARTFGYVVTAAAPDSYEESEQSSQVINGACADPTPAAPNVLTWDPVLTPPVTGDPSPEYYVYCDPYGNGTYGFIGTATGAATFNDPGLTPDFSITPPLARPLFDATDGYPSTCAYHQQRRYFGSTRAVPDGVFGSRVGFPDNFGISSPLQDDDAVTFRIAGNNHHAVRHLVGLKNLILMTDGGEWRLGTALGEPVTPSNIPLDQETYVGIAKDVPPVVVGNSIIYVQARQSKVHDLSFDQDVEGLAGRDLTVYASHLFDGHLIRSIDYALAPDSIVWCVRDDGVLLGLTYLKEQDIWGWHRHDTTDGDFESVCVIPHSGEDRVYFIVERDGARYIERLESRSIVNFNEDSFFVDSGLSYSGAPVSSVSGLGHLNGKTVRVVGDGVDLGTFVVGGGSVVLSAAYSNIHVGLPITAEIETLDLDVSGSSIRDKHKRPQGADIIIDASSRGFLAGSGYTGKLKRYVRSQYDPTDAAFTGQIEMNFDARWEKAARVFIRQDQALPLTVLAVLPLVELGG